MARKRIETAADLAQSAARFYAKALMQPMTALSSLMTLNQEITASLTGQSLLEPEKGDKRFKDPVWTSNPAYRALMQTYLAWQRGIVGWIEALDLPERDKLRAKLVASLVTDAMSPTNSLGGNPAAMKTTLERAVRT